MAKQSKTVFVCQECGYESSKWMGQCICGAWNSMLEERRLAAKESIAKRTGYKGAEGSFNRVLKPSRLQDVRSSESKRIDTGIGELNRVLGGGLVPGSLTLISGEPGIGKSTIIVQAAAHIARSLGKVLYVSGEESEEQIRIRADRVCDSIPGELYILAETNIENVEASCEELKPKFLIIDSIQTMYSEDLESSPGSVSQVRLCAASLMRLGKANGIPIFIIAHVTKSGDLAGPRILEHMVDCVLSFTGDRNHEMRILRSLKNRFGTTSEIGAFEMAERGLIEIKNLSGTLLEEMDRESDGAVATAIYEGTRPLIIEVQALTTPSNMNFPRRTALGIDNSRLSMIIAVMEKRLGLKLIGEDVYVNVVGGLKPEGTYTDLAMALAIYSSYAAKKLDSRTLVIGEIGLTGDLRAVQNTEKIVREAERMGFKQVVMPIKNAEKLGALIDTPLRLIGVRNLSAITKLFE